MSTFCQHGTQTRHCALCRLAAGDPDLIERLREQKALLGQTFDYAPPAPRPIVVHECEVTTCNRPVFTQSDYCERHTA